MTRQHTSAFGWSLALLVATVFCGLGVWQLQRMHEKQALLDQVPPGREKAMAVQQAMQAPRELHWVRDRLQFLPGSILLDNQLRHGRAGVKVYQPARADGGQVVLVDLGWLPLPADRRMPVITPQPGVQTLEGLWAPPPSAGLALGPALAAADQPRTWLATRIELPAISRALGVADAPMAPQVLRLDPALPLGYERDLELLPNTLPPSRHLGYAVQWFAMALAVLVIAVVLQWRRGRARR
ncbi:SURF1 family protein [Stenotrophomonas sp. ATCM1_4]|uniref:SURF1 family protein n=1 Tax=Stenotrophomonas sp. ATCM1_4 TaxID=2259330 RepID=UPI0010451D39|nr:SURF1 family protein [Stenotrophomonas sp. ATCM1_4]TDB29477.1 SURF1 family protein [Stenotrophomonas sp. ATCM1_4]